MKATSKILIWILLAVGCVSLVAFAAEPQVTMTFDRRAVTLNEEINLVIRIEGSGGNLERPRLPAIESFTSYYTGRSTHTKYEDGQATSISEFSFVLVPKAVGRFTFPEIEVEIADEIYRTSSIDLEVLNDPNAATTSAVAPQNQSAISAVNLNSQVLPPAPATSQIPRTQAQGFIPPGADSDIFLKAWTDKTVAYPNEPIVLTYSLYTRQDTQYEGFSEEPVITGFWLEQFPNPEKLEKTVVNIGGKRYIRADIRKMALFAQGTGTYTILPGSVKVSIQERTNQRRSFFDDFFDDSFFSSNLFSRRIPKVLGTQPLDVEIRPFPEAGKPASFSGVTGRFNITGSIDYRSVKQNEPVTLTLDIEGEGNIETLERPPIPNLEHFRIYDSDVTTKHFKRDDTIMGRKTFKVIFIPDTPGTYGIPAVELPYFDPRAGKYEVIRTQTFQINVAPGDPGASLELLPRELDGETGKKSVEIESHDIFFIKDRLERRMLDPLYPLTPRLFWLDVILTLALLGLVIYQRSQDALDSNVALKRRMRAPKAIRRGLRDLRRHLKDEGADSSQRFCELAQKTLFHYVADQLNVSAQSLTEQTIEDAVREKRESAETVEKLHRFFIICNEGRFTRAVVDQAKRGELMQIIESLARVMEKYKR